MLTKGKEEVNKHTRDTSKKKNMAEELSEWDKNDWRDKLIT